MKDGGKLLADDWFLQIFGGPELDVVGDGFDRSICLCHRLIEVFLKSGERLAGAFRHSGDRHVLIVARLEITAAIFEWHGGEAVSPRVLLGEGLRPQFIRRRISRNLALLTAFPVAFDAAERDRMLAADAAAFSDSPAGGG